MKKIPLYVARGHTCTIIYVHQQGTRMNCTRWVLFSITYIRNTHSRIIMIHDALSGISINGCYDVRGIYDMCNAYDAL